MSKVKKNSKKLPAKKDDNILTAKQLAFCREYLVDHNQTQAAIRAGYAAKSARQKGSALMAKINIKKKISEIQEALWGKMIMTKSEGLAILSKMGRTDITKAIDNQGNLDIKAVKKLGAGVKEFIQETVYEGERTTVRRKIKIADPRGAIAELAKQLGWQVEKDKDDPDGGNIFINIQNNFK